jgi:hypothetical protein
MVRLLRVSVFLCTVRVVMGLVAVVAVVAIEAVMVVAIEAVMVVDPVGEGIVISARPAIPYPREQAERILVTML